LERSAAEAIKTDLLVGELELVAERIAPHHLKKTCSVSLLDMMKHHLTGEAEVGALAHAVQMLLLRPELEVLSQPTFRVLYTAVTSSPKALASCTAKVPTPTDAP